MARKKGRRRKKPATPIGLMTYGGTGMLGYNYVLGGGDGIAALKEGDIGTWTNTVKSKLDDGWAAHWRRGMMFVAGVGGNKILGRNNPGITLGKYRIKLF